MIRLGQAEATDELAARELGQIFTPLRFRAVGIDRVHDERGLHRHGGAKAGVDTLDLTRNQAVGDVAEAGAAVSFWDGRAEEAELAHLADHGRIVFLLAISGEHAREQFLLGVIARGVAHHPLFFGQFAFEIERILPFEGGILDLDRFAFALLRKLRHARLLVGYELRTFLRAAELRPGRGAAHCAASGKRSIRRRMRP